MRKNNTNSLSVPSRRPLTVMFDVVHALFIREIKTRFGRSHLGYFWALAEPVALIVLFSAVYSLRGSEILSGVDITLFLLSGIYPFTLFRNTITKIMMAVKSNKALFIYRQVSPIDPIIARIIIEVAFYSLTYILFLVGLTWFGVDAWPFDPLLLLTAHAVLILLSFGIGLSLCCVIEYWGDIEKVFGMLMRPMFFLSGLFYVMSMIPQQYWHFFDWNPVLHLIELMRSAFFEEYSTEFANWSYPIYLSLSLTVLGLMLYRVNRYKLIASS